MGASLSNRIKILCVILSALLLALAALLLSVSHQIHQSLIWAAHSSQVLKATSQARSGLEGAEAGQRGFILTHDSQFAANFDSDIAEADRQASKLINLTRDNDEQHANARAIRRLATERIDTLTHAMTLARRGDFDGARTFVQGGRGRVVMTLIETRLDIFLAQERALSAQRMQSVEHRLDLLRAIVLWGVPLSLMFIVAMAMTLIHRIATPVRAMMDVMARLGAGDRTARIGMAMKSREFEQLADGYNAMAGELENAIADQSASQTQLHDANLELNRNADILRERGEVIELLGGMAHRMQAARTDEELAAIIGAFVPRVLPAIPGALYAHNNSRNLLIPTATWGGMVIDDAGFAPDQCWALRRGRSHVVTDPGADIMCAHAHGDHDAHGSAAPYHCEPLLAGGEVIGVLYLKGIIDAESRFRLTLLAENIASALVNHRLQRGLREQTIRDPLTGLFNRRYMEEALALEIARASRTGSGVSVVMCDVDHFKRFNDEFGHEAGDIVLQAVAAEMRQRFRDGDVVCRYGGEEFIIIAPGSTTATLADRVEIVRAAIAALTIRQNGKMLGATSMSFGVASWTESMARDGSALIRAADDALYRAKRQGRNCVVMADMPMALAG